TMGALHAGHLSLVELARRENDVVVVSVFVNPIQFGPGEDFDRYPRDPDRDARLLGEGEVDAIYEPRTELMYPPGASTRGHDGARAYAAGERDPVRLRAVLMARLRAEPLADLEYADLVDAATFEKPGTLAVIAARIGKTRLIDNHDLSIPLPG